MLYNGRLSSPISLNVLWLIISSILGFVPKLHLADINIKNPSLKFKENQRVKAKVLTVDPSKRRLTLTLKRSIIKNR